MRSSRNTSLISLSLLCMPVELALSIPYNYTLLKSLVQYQLVQWTECLSFFEVHKVHVLKPNPQRDGIWEWGSLGGD